MARPKHYNNLYRKKLKQKIESLSNEVFHRRDLVKNASSNAQLRLTRALNVLIKEGHIIKIAHGLYAKAKSIHLPTGENRIIPRKEFELIATQALDKLQVTWELGSAIQAYNRGETQQIPVRFTIRLKSRFRRNISIGKRKLHFEGGVNAR